MAKMLDRYICRLGYDTNIKIRDKDLKIKNLLDKTNEGIERWTTEVYNFPISAAIFRNITKTLNIDLPDRAIRDGQQLISILSNVRASVQIISVQKRRELHVWPYDDRNGATIELTQISIPEKVMTISIEHPDLEKVTRALEYLQLTSHSMKVLSYVDCLKVWVEEKRLF
ncbi:MAG TPA: hypothetical protein VN922_08120 [Bacteroidia bacterium]|nr:hypothetical protein [Bacteroidia bacterium]